MKNKEYSSYIKGLMEGACLDKNTPEGKIIAALVDLCDQMAGDIEALEEELDVANEYIEELDEDLGAVEEFLYDDDECDCDCDDEFEYDEYVCPNCKETISFSGEFNDDEYVCPNCGAKLEEA